MQTIGHQKSCKEQVAWNFLKTAVGLDSADLTWKNLVDMRSKQLLDEVRIGLMQMEVHQGLESQRSLLLDLIVPAAGGGLTMKVCVFLLLHHC